MHFSTSNNQGFLSITIVRSLFLWIMSVLASITIITHAAQVYSVTFSAYRVIVSMFFIIISLYVFWYVNKDLKRVTFLDYRALTIVILLGLIGGTISLFSIRGDGDSAFYTPNAVYYLQNQNEPMGFDIHFVSGGDNKLTSVVWGTALPYEYGRAVAAHYLGVSYLTVYYILSAAVVGFLIPLALYLGLAHFSHSSLNAALGTAFALGILVLLGETQYTFGTYSLNFAFFGKTLLFAVGIPLWIYLTISYFRKRTMVFWIMLFATSTSMVGATSSAIFLLTGLSLVLMIAALYIGEDKKAMVPVMIKYFLSHGYTITYALILIGMGISTKVINSSINSDYPDTFISHLLFFINPRIPVSPILVVLGTLASLYLTTGKQRSFLIAWIIAVLVLFLNPLVSPIIMKYATGQISYWRAFYLIPFPLVVGIAAAKFFQRYEKIPTFRRILLFSSIGLILVLLHFPAGSSSSLRNTLDLSRPRHNFKPQNIDNAFVIIALVPEGNMLAARPYSQMIPMYSSKHPQIQIVGFDIAFWLAENGREEEAKLRIEAGNFVNNGYLENLASFQQVVSQLEINSIVLRTKVYDLPDVEDFLNAQGYTNVHKINDYYLLWK